LWVLIDGDVPAAAGLSSSAAYEVSAARLFLAVQDQEMPGAELALLAQAAEHSHWVGVQCGIMDQFISANAVAGHALRIHCGTLESSAVRLSPELASILIIHSTVRRELVTSAYNERRAQCETALQQLNRASGNSKAFLAGYSPSDLQQWGKDLSDPEVRRAQHVITEQTRVIECEKALNRGDLVQVGELLNQSHRSLRDDYEVSCAELDSIHEIANGLQGVYGCRMTGAGFGGCAVALVEPDLAEAVAEQVEDQFAERWGKRPWTLLTPACGGAESWEH
jgi:galactokinase